MCVMYVSVTGVCVYVLIRGHPDPPQTPGQSLTSPHPLLPELMGSRQSQAGEATTTVAVHRGPVLQDPAVACPDLGSLLETLQQEGHAGPDLIPGTTSPRLTRAAEGPGLSQRAEGVPVERADPCLPRGQAVRAGFKPSLCPLCPC